MDGFNAYRDVAVVLIPCLTAIAFGVFGLYCSTKAAAYDRTEKALEYNRNQTSGDFARAVNNRHDIIFAARMTIGMIMASVLIFLYYAMADGISTALFLLAIALILLSVASTPIIRSFRNTHSFAPFTSRRVLPHIDELKEWWQEEKAFFRGAGILFGAWSAFLIQIGILGLMSLLPFLDVPAPLAPAILRILQLK